MNEVNELLFLWIAAINQELASNLDARGSRPEREQAINN